MAGYSTYYEMDHYAILNLPITASEDDIKKQYRKLSRKFHPDKIGNTLENNVRFSDIGKSYTVLSCGEDRFQRKDYDDNHKTKDFNCPNCPRRDVNKKGGFPRSKSSLRYFCSGECARVWNQANAYTPNTHNHNPGTGGGGGTNNNDGPPNTPPPPAPPKILQRTCPGCQKKKNFSSHWWTRYSEFSSIHSQYCCSEYCLFNYLQTKGINPKRCFKCGKVKKLQEADIWLKDTKTKNIFCSQQHLAESNGSGLGGGGYRPDDNTDPLLAEKNAAISAIDSKLLEDPEIDTSELESVNQNWANDIQNATSPTEITTIRDRVLADINNQRQTKKKNSDDGTSNNLQLLEKARAKAINLITSKLAESPQIATSELNNSNWEKEIKQATDISTVNQIRDQVLADIKNKRLAKAEEKTIITLLEQARAATTYQELESILQEIKLLRSSNAYRKYEGEIQEQEARLRSLDPEKYKETARKSIQEQLAQNGLRWEDFDQKTRSEIEEAINSGDSAKISQVEEKIAIKGGEKQLDDVLILAKKATTIKEKKQLIDELLKLIISDNNYLKLAYQNRKPEVDRILAELRGKSQSKNRSSPKKFPYLAFSFLLVSLLGIALTGFLILRKKRQQARQQTRKT